MDFQERAIRVCPMYLNGIPPLSYIDLVSETVLLLETELGDKNAHEWD